MDPAARSEKEEPVPATLRVNRFPAPVTGYVSFLIRNQHAKTLAPAGPVE